LKLANLKKIKRRVLCKFQLIFSHKICNAGQIAAAFGMHVHGRYLSCKKRTNKENVLKSFAKIAFEDVSN
jgi:hypothetical protein